MAQCVDGHVILVCAGERHDPDLAPLAIEDALRPLAASRRALGMWLAFTRMQGGTFDAYRCLEVA